LFLVKKELFQFHLPPLLALKQPINRREVIICLLKGTSEELVWSFVSLFVRGLGKNKHLVAKVLILLTGMLFLPYFTDLNKSG
jgi:hypothetical protein